MAGETARQSSGVWLLGKFKFTSVHVTHMLYLFWPGLMSQHYVRCDSLRGDGKEIMSRTCRVNRWRQGPGMVSASLSAISL